MRSVKPRGLKDKLAGRGWPSYLLGGRVRTSTAGLLVLFVALFWVQQTFAPEPKPTPAPQQVVPPGFVPDPDYTWVPRTQVQEPTTTRRTPRTTTTTTTPPTTTTTTTTTPSTTSPSTPAPPTTTVVDPDGPGLLPPQTVTATPTPAPAPLPLPILPGLPG